MHWVSPVRERSAWVYRHSPRVLVTTVRIRNHLPPENRSLYEIHAPAPACPHRLRQWNPGSASSIWRVSPSVRANLPLGTGDELVSPTSDTQSELDCRPKSRNRVRNSDCGRVLPEKPGSAGGIASGIPIDIALGGLPSNNCSWNDPAFTDFTADCSLRVCSR